MGNTSVKLYFCKFDIIRRKTFAMLSFILLLITSCQEGKKKEVSVDTISLNLNQIYEPDFKELFDSIEICPLEVSDSSLIGKFFRKRAMYIPNKYYVVIDANYVIYLFDMKGKLISNSSGCIGQGPQEYYILQDVAYNYVNDTFDVLDPFGNITVFDSHFRYISKIKIEAQTKERFRKLFVLDKSQYALFDDTERGSFIIYDSSKNGVIKKVTYPGLIAEMSANNEPFTYSDHTFYFVPPEVNDYLFIYNQDEKELVPNIYMDGGEQSIGKSDLAHVSTLAETSEFILQGSYKYTPVDRLYGQNYIFSTYLNQQKTFVNICNIATHSNKTFKREPGLKVNLPVFFSVVGNVAYAVVYPHDVEEFVDSDLVVNKDVLSAIKEDDNPYIIKYSIKF